VSPSRPPAGGWPERAPRRPGTGLWRAKGKRPFGETWWGRAWVESLEQRARLDTNRLPRGRTYARTGAVGDLEMRAGEVRAAVQGSRATPYRVVVRVRRLSEEEWDATVDSLSAQVGHTAALLDGELPPEVGEELRAAGLDLLPGAGEVEPRCSCPDRADPCKHSAAVCYLVADQLDTDPFQLFLLRGKGRPDLMAALRTRRLAAHGAGAGGPGADQDRGGALLGHHEEWDQDPGMPALEAWSTAPDGAPRPRALPPLPLPPPQPGRPAVLAVDPPPAGGLTAEALRALAADAASRAFDLAHGGDLAAAGLGLTMREDLARRAAAAAGGGSDLGRLLSQIATRARLSSRELRRWALAWEAGGQEGLFVLTESWEPPPEAVAAGKALAGPGATAWRNRVSSGPRQLRLGRDGRWYPYRRSGRAGFEPDGPPGGSGASRPSPTAAPVPDTRPLPRRPGRDG
jgi:uncharacterized Zn finger protein